MAAYELFNGTELLGRMAMDKMLAGLSTRRYPVGLEPVGEQVTQTASGISKSAVSRTFVAQTETALTGLLSADLSHLDLVALMVDGVHFAGSCCIVALGIDLQGTKVPLALVEGSTENATLVTELLVGLRERGLDVPRPILTVLDGSKAQRRVVRDVFDTPVLARYSSTRSATLGTSCPRSCVLESNGGCAPTQQQRRTVIHAHGLEPLPCPVKIEDPESPEVGMPNSSKPSNMP